MHYQCAICIFAEFRIWKGTVTQRGPGFLFQLGRWRVKYHQRSETLPFPPYDSRIVLCGARIRKPGRSNNRRKARKTRVLCGKHALRDDGPKGSAVKKCLAVGTLSTTSLKLEGDDVFKLKASARLHEIVRYMAQTNLHILALQETRFTFTSGEGFDILKRKLRHGNKIFFIYLMSAVKGYNGMGFITQEPIKAWKVNDRIIAGEFNIEGGSAFMLNAYGPTRDSPEEAKQEFDISLTNAFHEAVGKAPRRPALLLGDLNAPLTFGKTTEEDELVVERLKGLLEGIDCKSGHSLCPSKRVWTCILPNDAKRQLDHIAVCSRFASALRHHQVFAAPTPTVHFLVRAEIRIKWKISSNIKRSKIHWFQLSNPEHAEKFNNRICEQVAAQLHTEDLPSWDLLASCLRSSGKEIPKPITKISLDIQEPVEGLQGAETDNLRNIFMQSKRHKDFNELVSHNRGAIEDAITRSCEVLESKMKKNHASPWRAVKEICGVDRADFNIPGTSNRQKLVEIKTFFEAFAGDTGGDDNIRFLEANLPTNTLEDAPFTEEELRSGISHFGRGKAPGKDEIPMEAFACIVDNDYLRKWLLSIINRVYDTGLAPEVWGDVLQVPIPKKGDLTLLKNWRPICLVNCVVKLMNCLILQRIRPYVEPVLRHNQFGFRPDRSGGFLLMGAFACIVDNDKELRMVTGEPDPSQTDLEVPRPTSSTSFRLSKAAPTCCCQHASSTNCTSTRLIQEV